MELKKPADTLLEDMMCDAVTDAALFRTYDDDFEIIDRDQVMRCLALLDAGVYKFNKLFNIMLECMPPSIEETKNAYIARSPIDAIFTALTIMQKNLQKAVEFEAKKAIESRNEMKALGEKE